MRRKAQARVKGDGAPGNRQACFAPRSSDSQCPGWLSERHGNVSPRGMAAPADTVPNGIPFGRAFAIGIVLNSGFVVVEAAYGIIAGSMASVADAGHNLSDVSGSVIAWGASVLTARPPSARFTYGFKSSSISAALANASSSSVASGAIVVETIRRSIEPEPVAGGPV
ncbi:hypothetical protein OY671_008669, partial [Metschnikowia pulcherrima]